MVPLNAEGRDQQQAVFRRLKGSVLFIVGIADDLVGVRWRQKFLVQIFAAAMFPLAGLYVNDFYGMFGIYSISVYIGVPLSILLVVFITNAINLIDGIDGLASGLSIVALFVSN